MKISHKIGCVYALGARYPCSSTDLYGRASLCIDVFMNFMCVLSISGLPAGNRFSVLECASIKASCPLLPGFRWQFPCLPCSRYFGNRIPIIIPRPRISVRCVGPISVTPKPVAVTARTHHTPNSEATKLSFVRTTNSENRDSEVADL